METVRTILFLDTETNGIGKKNKPATDPCQPDLVQFAGVLTDSALNRISSVNLLVYQHQEIPQGAINVHRITNEMASQFGLSLPAVMGVISEMIECAERIVIHNKEFDMRVLRRAAHVCGMPDPFNGKEVWDTMLAGKDVTKIPWQYGGFKNPSMTELHEYFFNEGIVGAHNAMNDVDALIRIYGKLCEYWGIT